MRNSFKQTLALTQRNLKEIVRDPISLIFTFGLPLVMEVLFYFLFHANAAQFEMQYLAPGIVVFSQAFLTLFTGLLISVDRNSSFLTRLYVTKLKSYQFILGYVLALLPIALIQSVLFFLVGGAIDPSLFRASVPLCILLSLVSALFFISVGIMFGALCNEKSVGGVSSIVISGQSLLSGMWFPTEGLNQGIIIAMDCLPFRNASMLLQNTLIGIGDPFADFGRPFLILAAYTLVAFISAIFLFKRKMTEN